MNVKNYGSNFGCLDLFLLLMLATSVFVVVSAPGSSLLPGAIFWLVVGGLGFAWRRGWIQRYRDEQKAKEQAAAAAARRAEAERKAASTSNLGQAMHTNPSEAVMALSAPAATLSDGPSSEGPSIDSTSLTTTTNSNAWTAEAYYPIYSITVPAETAWKPSSAIGLLRALFEKSGQGVLQFSIVATAEQMEWQVKFMPNNVRDDLTLAEVQNAVQTYYRDASVEMARIPLFSQPVYRRYRLYALSGMRYFDRALNANQIKARLDPLEGVVGALSNLRSGEVMRFDVTVLGVNLADEAELERVLTKSAREEYEWRRGGRHYGNMEGMVLGEVAGGAISILNNWRLKKQKILRYSEVETERYMQKLGQPLAGVLVSLSFDTPDRNRLSVVDDAAGSVLELSGDEIAINSQDAFVAKEIRIGSFDDAVTKTPLDYLWNLAPQDEKEVDQTGKFIFNLTAEELAAMWHLPHEAYDIGSINWVTPTPREVLDVRAPSLTVGQVQVQGQAKDVQVRLVDLAKHMFVSGMTGTGKSTFFHNLAHQLVQMERGFTVLDPHGKLVQGILQTSILESVKDRVLVLELNQDEYPVPLNIFRRVDGVSRSDAVSHILNTLKKLYQSQWSETQMERVFRGFLELILSDPNATPLDVQEVASKEGYRNRLLNQALARTDRKQRLSRGTRNFWSEFLGLSDSNRNRMTQPVFNRLNIFLGKSEVELMTCHPGAINFRQVIDDNMIVLVDLSGQGIASEAESLGAILFAQLYNTVQAMGYQADGAEPRHYLIIDETHRFMTDMAELAFSEARKFGLSLMMADQWIGQLDAGTQEAIVNNKGTTLTFRVADKESQKTASLFRPNLEPEHLVKFGVGDAAIATLADGANVDAFQMKTYDRPAAFEGVLSETAIRERSHANLARLVQYQDARFKGRLLTADEIEDWLDERYTQPEFDPQVKEDETVVTEVDLKPRTTRRNADESSQDDESEELSSDEVSGDEVDMGDEVAAVATSEFIAKEVDTKGPQVPKGGVPPENRDMPSGDRPFDARSSDEGLIDGLAQDNPRME